MKDKIQQLRYRQRIRKVLQIEQLHPKFNVDSFKFDVVQLENDGGSGSGNWGHAGVPGQLGGSAPGGGKANRITTKSGYTSEAKQRKEAATLHTLKKGELSSVSDGTRVRFTDKSGKDRSVVYDSASKKYKDSKTGQEMSSSELEKEISDSEARIFIPKNSKASSTTESSETNKSNGQEGTSATPNSKYQASMDRLQQYKEFCQKCTNNEKLSFLFEAGAISLDTWGQVQDMEDKDAKTKIVGELVNKYFEQAESSKAERTLEDRTKNITLTGDSDDRAVERAEQIDSSAMRKLTPEESKWANLTSRVQREIIDQGLNGTPQVLSKEDFDAYVTENDTTVIYRGVRPVDNISSNQMINRLLYNKDEPFIGNGIYGDGLYFTTKENTAESYAYTTHNSGKVLKCTIRKDAKILDWVSDEYDKAKQFLSENTSIVTTFSDRDFTAPALLLGADILRVNPLTDESYYIVLNKEALVASDPLDDNNLVQSRLKYTLSK